MRPKPKTCSYCQLLFTPQYSDIEKYCSPKCRRDAENARVMNKRHEAKKTAPPKRDENA